MKQRKTVNSIQSQQMEAQQLRDAHLYLNKQYYKKIFGEQTRKINSHDDYVNFKRIEQAWIEDKIAACQRKYPCKQKITSMDIFAAALKSHPVYEHQLFDYLRYAATFSELKYFISNESILNLEFFDYLVMAIIGVSDESKSEIIKNIWDEAGHGDSKQFHTALFRKLMTQLGLPYQREKILANMSCEGIEGINLFNCMALNPERKMQYFGLMAATEMLDPEHYHRFIKGIERLNKDGALDIAYYVEHEGVDVESAHGWLCHVILPELEKRPELLQDFWLGFYLRLDSAKGYYDNLLAQFMTSQAA